MPYAAPRVCARCRQLHLAGQSCRPAWEGSTHPRDTAKWKRVRRNKLRMTPLCEWPGCRLLAAQVDHIVPLAEHGDRYAYANLQSLCREHAIVKTTADAQRGRRRARG